MSENCFWYVEPLDPETNNTIAAELDAEDAHSRKKCKDGLEHNLWQCDHAFIARLGRAKKSLRLFFNIYVQKGQRGDIKRWLFEKKKVPSPLQVHTARA